MERLKNGWVWFVVIVIYLVGLTGFMVPALHDLFVILIPVNILFAFAVLLLGEERFTSSKGIFFLICFLFGYGIEWVGTQTGIIFGEYAYGNGLGIKIGGVPLLIGVNWFFMVYTSLIISAKLSASPYIRVFLAPLFMVLYDFFLEPFAMRNNMWTWVNDTVPVQNYVAWYMGGLLLAAIAIWGKFETKNKYAVGLYGIQLVFFVVLFFWNRLF